MAHPQDAYQTLNELRQPDWLQRRAGAANKLPDRLRDITVSLLGVDSNGEIVTDYQKLHWAHSKANKQLALLKSSERLTIFETLFPQFANHVDATWQLYNHLPYQVGGERKAFRAPELAPDHAARTNWLMQLIRVTGMYDQDIIWLATWAAFIGHGYQQDVLGTLFAGAIQSGGSEGQQVFEILKASAYGEHEIGKMGRHVTRALLTVDDPNAWDAIEKLLIAAQRQEGLRQVILETIDEAHPEAFKRFIRLILENDLTRFSSVIRAVDVWFGFQYDALKQKEVNAVLTEVSEYLEYEAARDKAINEGEPQSAYLALWALAVEDAVRASDRASDMMFNDPDPERRLVGVHMSDLIGFIGAYKRMITVLQQEDDMRVVARALHALTCRRYRHYYGANQQNPLAGTELFEALERIIPHLPDEKTYGPLIWPWMSITIERQAVASMLMSLLGDRSPKRLIPYINELSIWGRRVVAETLSESDKWDDLTRQTLFKLVTDRSAQVRRVALKAIQGVQEPTAEEITFLEGQLYRKSSDVRRGIIKVLIKQPDENALASADRLTNASKAPQREAGLEILRQMVEQERAAERCRIMASTYAQEAKRLSAGEETLLDLLTSPEEDVPTLDDGLGLFDPADRTPSSPPQLKLQTGSLVSDAAIACIQSLDELIHEYSQEPVQIDLRDGKKREMLLGDLRWQFPMPLRNLPRPENLARLPLVEVWQTWDKQRGDDSRDTDGRELVRALAHLRAGHYRPGYSTFFHSHHQPPAWQEKLLDKLAGADKQGMNLRYPATIDHIIEWLIWMQSPDEVVQLLLDNVDITFGLLPQSKLHEGEDHYVYYYLWQQLLIWLNLARWHRSRYPEQWQDDDHVRSYGLLRWLEENYKDMLRRDHLDLYDVLLAYRAGGATLADLYHQLIGTRNDGNRWNSGFYELRQYSGRKKRDRMLEFPVLGEVNDNCRRRIVEVELNRGDLPTAASKPALSLRWSGGADTLVNVLKAMGRTPFVRGWVWDSASKKNVFSHLIRATCPEERDTPEHFAALAHEAGLSEKRLIEVALYVPQWADHVQAALGWDNFSEAVWWIVAHTKDANWRVDQEIRETWAAAVSQRTPLSSINLLNGAVDVAWFWRVYESLGKERWEKVYQAAKYTSSSGGHKRAQLFADALLGRVTIQDIEGRITTKRHRDALRALGLLPLHPGDGRDDDLLHRYEIIQEFKRTSRKFGAQRRESDSRAVEVALENLARGAGYTDPQRLTWAMEKQAVASLTDGPLTATYENYSVTLSVDVTGSPELTIINDKTGRKLKNVPGKAKKDPAIAELRELASTIRRQVSRMRQSLEAAMIRGDIFTFAEVVDLLDHPVLCPMLEQLVFIGTDHIGYPIRGQDGLQYYDGIVHNVPGETELRIAHPDDLLRTGEWDAWQRECFLAERIQPFKQVFRELYILTETEEDDYQASRRYAGHQVNVRQAIALLASRGWVNHYEEGARKTFHDEGITVWVASLAGGYTPAEVEGLTIETVVFVRRGEWKPMPLVEVPPRLFSEVMRDLDLVVSVAHVGGVDPEASASTVEMRAALIRETCLALKLANVTMSEVHAAIQGELGSYSVHLGSGIVHRQPGGALCIIPVHSQHRGRIFLPFADDDPKTAEVLSKIILLAQDNQIQDPTILEQILAR